MTDPLVISFANQTAPILLQSTSAIETNWTQFAISITTSLLAAFGLFIVLLTPGGFKALINGLKLTRTTGRPTLVIRHNAGGLFDTAMIDGKTLNRITKFLNKHHYREVNIILHTPGGTIFHSMACSDAIHEHGKVHMYVPVMAMSGGTLLSMSAYTLHMGRAAALGPVDPQIGTWWTFGSAWTWKEVLRRKGKNARDESITFEYMGRQYTKEVQDQMKKLGVPKSTIKVLTDGKLAHGHRFTLSEVRSMRKSVYYLNGETYDLCVKATV